MLTGPPTARAWPSSATPGNSHWRLEYPLGKVLIDGIGWISQPKISPDGKWVAFADHENTGGDDQGTVAVIAADGKGKEKKLSSGWSSIEGILWSPAGDEIWFTASDTGSANNPHGVTLAGKQRTITNVPGGVWLQDIHNGVVLAVSHITRRLGIRGLAPGGKRKRNWAGSAGPSCVTSAATAGKSSSKRRAMAADPTTPSSCATPMAPPRCNRRRCVAISPDNNG